MASINLPRVVVGGLAAGVIIDIGEMLLNAVVIADQWAAVQKSLNQSTETTVAQIAAYNVWGLIAGLAAVWLYAAIAPRFGFGARTAVCAGSALWLTVWLLGSSFLVIQGWAPAGLWAIMMIWGLVEAVLATAVGARLYRE